MCCLSVQAGYQFDHVEFKANVWWRITHKVSEQWNNPGTLNATSSSIFFNFTCASSDFTLLVGMEVVFLG